MSSSTLGSADKDFWCFVYLPITETAYLGLTGLFSVFYRSVSTLSTIEPDKFAPLLSSCLLWVGPTDELDISDFEEVLTFDFTPCSLITLEEEPRTWLLLFEPETFDEDLTSSVTWVKALGLTTLMMPRRRFSATPRACQTTLKMRMPRQARKITCIIDFMITIHSQSYCLNHPLTLVRISRSLSLTFWLVLSFSSSTSKFLALALSPCF